MRLDARITMLRQTEAIATDGTPSVSPVRIADVWAHAEMVAAAESDRAGTRTVRFTVRHSPDTARMQPRDAIAWQGRHYAIATADPQPLARPRFIVFTATTSADSLA